MTGRFVGHALDMDMLEGYDPQVYEYRGPYLASEELSDLVTDDQWRSEVQACEEDWDNAPDFRPPPDFRRLSAPAPNVDYSEANHLYISAGTMALIEMIQHIAQRVNFNPPKRGMSTTVTVPIKKEVPAPVAQPPKYIGVTKMGRSLRVPLDQLPLYKYRGWKEMRPA